MVCAAVEGVFAGIDGTEPWNHWSRAYGRAVTLRRQERNDMATLSNEDNLPDEKGECEMGRREEIRVASVTMRRDKLCRSLCLLYPTYARHLTENGHSTRFSNLSSLPAQMALLALTLTRVSLSAIRHVYNLLTVTLLVSLGLEVEPALTRSRLL